MAAPVFSVALLLIAVAMPSLVDAADFQFIRATDTTACINFRGTSTDAWKYISPTGISKRSAEAFCRTYLPSATTGVITTSDTDCRFYGSTLRYTTNIDCADKNAALSSCNITGSTSPTYTTQYAYFYGAGIECVTNPRWDYYSSFSTSITYFSTEGTYGVKTGRAITVSPTVVINSIRPDYAFTSGTICIPPTPNEQVGTNLAKALCRTAGHSVSSNSTVGNSTSSSAYVNKYASNIQCSSSSTATLFNGGCTNTTHYNDEPATECSPYLPKITCPVRFDIKLGDPIVSSGSDRGYQLVQLRPEGSDNYDGMMCISSIYTSNFANVMCHEMYGDDIDFAAAYSSSSGALPTNITKQYISSVGCASSTYTKLSQCYGTITATAYQYPCSSYRGMVACKLSEDNIVFSIDRGTTTATNADANPGKGYLMASVSIAGQTTPAAVCSDGFNQAAALAACRSVGFTPGPSASFTVATTTSIHAINNVTCPTGANKLTDCKLQYSGTGYKTSYSANQVCSGRVYLNCDLGTPTVQFRMDSSRYLQARLYTNSEWGWVKTSSGTGYSSVSSEAGYNAMCTHATSTTGDSTISKSFLTVSYCYSSSTSYTDCTYEYTNGVSGTRDFYCNPPYNPSPSSYSSQGSSGGGLGTAGTIGLGVGISFFVIIIIIICVCVCIFNKRKTPPTDMSSGIEMTTTNNQLLTVPSNPAVYNFASHSGGGAAPASEGGIYGNGSNTGSPFGYSQSQGPPPTDYPPPQAGGYFPQQTNYPQQSPQYGGGDMYGQPVMGTAYNGGGDIYGSAPPPTANPYGSGGNPIDCQPSY